MQRRPGDDLGELLGEDVGIEERLLEAVAIRDGDEPGDDGEGGAVDAEADRPGPLPAGEGYSDSPK